MAVNLSISQKQCEKAIILELSGEIAIDTVDELRTILESIVEEHSVDIRLNCEKLNYIDSTGLGVLVGILKKVKNNGKNIYLTHLKSSIKKLFVITNLDKVFIIEG